MSRIYTVAECDERIGAAQHVLENPGDYPAEVRVDADKSVRRWSVIRDHAELIEVMRDKLKSWEEDA